MVIIRSFSYKCVLKTGGNGESLYYDGAITFIIMTLSITTLSIIG
jgi:hypothetical protein